MAITHSLSLNQVRDDYLTKFETAFEPPLRPTKKIVYFVGGPADLTKQIVDLHLDKVVFNVPNTRYMNGETGFFPYEGRPYVTVDYRLVPVAFSHADNMEIWVGVPQ